MKSTTLKMNDFFSLRVYVFTTHYLCKLLSLRHIVFHIPFHLLSAIVPTSSATTSTTTPKVVTQGQNTGKSCTLHVPHIALCVPMFTFDVSYNKQKYLYTGLFNYLINDSLV